METEKDTKDKYFIRVVSFGTLGVIASNVFSDDFNFFVLLIEATGFIVIMYALFYIVPAVYKNLTKRFSKLLYTPKIKLKFVLVKENDLRLYIHNSGKGKNVLVDCYHVDFLTIRGKKYLQEFPPSELKMVRDSRSGHFPLFQGTLSANDKREIRVGIPINGKVALHYMSNDAPYYNFRDGRFEYVINCNGKYLGKSFFLPHFSVWLTIKDGVLIQIEDDLISK